MLHIFPNKFPEGMFQGLFGHILVFVIRVFKSSDKTQSIFSLYGFLIWTLSLSSNLSQNCSFINVTLFKSQVFLIAYLWNVTYRITNYLCDGANEENYVYIRSDILSELSIFKTHIPTWVKYVYSIFYTLIHIYLLLLKKKIGGSKLGAKKFTSQKLAFFKKFAKNLIFYILSFFFV